MPGKLVSVTVNSGRVLHVHPDLADGHLAAPTVEEVAEHGIPTASATQLVEGDALNVPRETADRLVAVGIVTRT